jgi:hypothetical protein
MGAPLFRQGLIATNGTHIRRRGFASAAFLCLGSERQPTTLDSHSLLPLFLRYVIKRPSIAFQNRLLAGVLLISPNDAVGVLRIDLYETGLAVSALARDQRAAGAPE